MSEWSDDKYRVNRSTGIY